MTAQHDERIPQWTQGDRLRKARSLTGLNSRDFAELIGVSQKTINNAEAETHGVRKIVLNAWAMATGVPVKWLEDGSEPSDGGPGPGSGDTPTDALKRLTASKSSRSAGSGHNRQYASAA